jgi:hypothetical protein
VLVEGLPDSGLSRHGVQRLSNPRFTAPRPTRSDPQTHPHGSHSPGSGNAAHTPSRSAPALPLADTQAIRIARPVLQVLSGGPQLSPSGRPHSTQRPDFRRCCLRKEPLTHRTLNASETEIRAEESGASCYFAKILAYTGEFHPCTFPAPAPGLREPFTLFTPGRIPGRREAPTTRLGLSLREILNHPCQQIDHAVELLLAGGM